MTLAGVGSGLSDIIERGGINEGSGRIMWVGEWLGIPDPIWTPLV